MRSIFLTLLFCCGCSGLNIRKEEASPATKISEICFKNKPASIPTEKIDTANLLKSLQSKYAEVAFRKKDEAAFVKDVDKLLIAIGEEELISCKNKLKIVTSLKGKTSAFEPILEKTGNKKETYRFEINLEPELTVQALIPVYAHELLHACQHEETIKLRDSRDQLSAQLTQNELWGWALGGGFVGVPPKGVVPTVTDRVRNLQSMDEQKERATFLKEIAAFVKMRNVYVKLISLDSGYCHEKSADPNKDTLGRAKVFYERFNEQIRGHFAQRVIHWYSKDQGGPFALTQAVVILNSTDIVYPGTSTEEGFKLKRLNPTMVQEIEKLGLSVNQP